MGTAQIFRGARGKARQAVRSPDSSSRHCGEKVRQEPALPTALKTPSCFIPPQNTPSWVLAPLRSQLSDIPLQAGAGDLRDYPSLPPAGRMLPV